MGYNGPMPKSKPGPPGDGLVGLGVLIFVFVLIAGGSLVGALIAGVPLAAVGTWIGDRATAKEDSRKRDKRARDREQYLKRDALRREQLSVDSVVVDKRTHEPPPHKPKHSQKDGPCPSCGGSLVKRINRKTNQKFYGCSTFPSCRYTKSLNR